MKISREQVLHVANLAKVGLTEEDIETYGEQLSAILEYIDILNELDTTTVAPTYHVMPLSNVARPDEISPSLPPELVLANAPQAQDNFFRVAPVLEEDEAARVDHSSVP